MVEVKVFDTDQNYYGQVTAGSTVVPNGLAPEICRLSGGAGDFGTMEWGYPIVRDD